MRIFNGNLVTVENGTFPCGYVDFEDGKITSFGDVKDAPEYSGEVLDANGGYIMPGFIDAHTHIAICEEGASPMGSDCNESASSPVTPELRALDGTNPWDPSIKKAREAGVTAAGISPGSANVIGGQIAAVKLAGKSVEEMAIKPFAAMKMALGENPKKVYGQRNVSPKTRMSIAAIMRKNLTKAQQYLEKKEAGEKVCELDMEALLPVIKREVPVHFHAHEADDILTAIRIAHEFNLKYTIVHATDAGRILDEIAAENIIPIVGPSAIWFGKHEGMNNSMETPGKLYDAGTEVTLTTDHDVTPLWLLPIYAGVAVREGLPEDAAFRALTINAAKNLGVEDRIGSIAVGKDADVVVFSGHPFNYLTKVQAVFIDGKRYK